ncbi:MAG: hypothetical protein KatS3mg097_463 [Candidatus Parcubacteria bacterium]|nr:MAG: hypothetical protein KatS3mg097_463 [Candidatus Parcubacteria bacterium]
MIYGIFKDRFNFSLLIITIVLSFSLFFISSQNNQVLAQQICLPTDQYLIWEGDWLANNIPMTSSTQNILAPSPMFVFNNNIGIGTTTPQYTLHVIGSVAADTVCIAGDCRNEWPVATDSVSGSGAVSQVAFWVDTKRISGDSNFIWNTSSHTLVVNGTVSSTNLIGALDVGYVQAGVFGSKVGIGDYTFPSNLTINNNLYVTNTILAMATITTNKAFCINNSCINAWPETDYVRGTGTTDRLVKWINTSTVGNSIIYEKDNKIGINYINPEATLDINGSLQVLSFIMPPGAQDDYVLTSDDSGRGTWQPKASLPVGACVLASSTDAIPPNSGFYIDASVEVIQQNTATGTYYYIFCKTQ